jgi:hypothetical protein
MTTVSYVPKLKAEEASGNKWKDLQNQVSQYRDNIQQRDNGWGNLDSNPGNPYDMSAVIANMNTQMQNVLGQGGAALDQQRSQAINEGIALTGQAYALQSGADAARAQAAASAVQAQQPEFSLFDGGLARSAQINDRTSAAANQRLANNQQSASAEYMQGQQNQAATRAQEAQRHMQVLQNQNNAQTASIAANAQTNTARIGADAGVLSSMFNSFGQGGGGYRYW